MYRSKLEMPLDEVARFVAGRYGLRVELLCVRNGYMSTTVHLNSGGRKYVLKVYLKRDFRTEAFDFTGRLNARFRACGIPVPDLVRTGGGDDFAVSGQNLFQLWRFVEGEVFTPGNRVQLQAAGAMLGRMHRAGEELAAGVDPAAAWRAAGAELEQNWRELEKAGGPLKMLEELAEFRECLAEVGDLAVKGLPVSVAHGDFRAQNLLFNGGEVVAVLDPDAAKPGPRLFDPAYACLFFQAVIAAHPLAGEEMAVFLRAYDREAGLRDVERGALPGFLVLSLLRGMTLWMRIAYVDEANNRAAEWLAAYRPLLGWIAREGDGFAAGI